MKDSHGRFNGDAVNYHLCNCYWAVQYYNNNAWLLLFNYFVKLEIYIQIGK